MNIILANYVMKMHYIKNKIDFFIHTIKMNNNELFYNLDNLKNCLNTLYEHNGLLYRRNFILHDSFKNYNLIDINNENSYYSIAQNIQNTNNYLFIYFINNTSFLSKTYKTKNINILDCKKYIQNLYNINNNNILLDIIVIFTKDVKINYLIQKKLFDKLDKNNIQLFDYKKLLFNISNHNFVPKSIKIISDKIEIDDICKKKNISSLKQLPKINILDALSNFYGIKEGELFEFKKYNQNAGIYIYYRLCVV